MGSEVALSTLLVSLASPLVTSLVNLLHVDKGFLEKHATAIDINLPDTQYPMRTAGLDFLNER